MSLIKIILLSIIITSISSAKIFSQNDYVKIVVPGNKSEIRWEFGSRYPHLYSQVLITCDTVHLNGHIYNEVEVTDDPSIDCEPGGYIREDTVEQRIYFINRFDEENLNEIFIADFSLEIGDTFEFDNGWGKQVLEDIRYINYHGSSQVKFFDFGLDGIEGFVEGHGRLSTGILDRCRTVGFPRYNGLERNELDCNSITSTSVVEVFDGVKVSPNPVRDYLKVEYGDGLISIPVEYDLISVMGRLIQNGELNSDNIIYLGDVPIGAFYLILKRKGEKIVKKIMHY